MRRARVVRGLARGRWSTSFAMETKRCALTLIFFFVLLTDGFHSSTCAMMIGSGFRGDSSREDTGDEGGAGATGDDGAHGSWMFE